MHMAEIAMRKPGKRRRLFAVRIDQIRNLDRDLPDTRGEAQQFPDHYSSRRQT